MKVIVSLKSSAIVTIDDVSGLVEDGSPYADSHHPEIDLNKDCTIIVIATNQSAYFRSSEIEYIQLVD